MIAVGLKFAPQSGLHPPTLGVFPSSGRSGLPSFLAAFGCAPALFTRLLHPCTFLSLVQLSTHEVVGDCQILGNLLRTHYLK